jgi:hypothetical protein
MSLTDPAAPRPQNLGDEFFGLHEDCHARK